MPKSRRVVKEIGRRIGQLKRGADVWLPRIHHARSYLRGKWAAEDSYGYGKCPKNRRAVKDVWSLEWGSSGAEGRCPGCPKNLPRREAIFKEGNLGTSMKTFYGHEKMPNKRGETVKDVCRELGSSSAGEEVRVVLSKNLSFPHRVSVVREGVLNLRENWAVFQRRTLWLNCLGRKWLSKNPPHQKTGELCKRSLTGEWDSHRVGKIQGPQKLSQMHERKCGYILRR